MSHSAARGIAHLAPPTRAHTPLNRQQIAGFWAAWFGWMLDGMDSVIYRTPPRAAISRTTTARNGDTASRSVSHTRRAATPSYS
jgi:hypothetical protein